MPGFGANDRVMVKLPLLGFAVALALAPACSRTRTQSGAARSERPWKHDEKEADARAPSQSLAVQVNGKSASWSPEQLAAIATSNVPSKQGANRQGWVLGDIARQILGPRARIVRVVGEGSDHLDVAPADTIFLRVTRDGSYKAVRERDESVVRPVREVEVEIQN
jgi:hypothetical protein